jgi:transposase-like protein
MSEIKKRVSHTADFKAKVGLEAIRSDQTINEIAQLYEIHPAQVAQWKKAILDQCKVVFEGKRSPKPFSEHSDPERLYSQIGKLKVELDWLKKIRGQPTLIRMSWIGKVQGVSVSR